MQMLNPTVRFFLKELFLIFSRRFSRINADLRLSAKIRGPNPVTEISGE